MYSVSEEYKKAMKLPVQRHFLKGTIGSHRFTEKNILSGSFSITNQCSGNDNVEIGQVYIGELSATFIDVPMERYGWKGVEIIPEFGMELPGGSIEYVPLGVFTIDSAEWTSSGVAVKAYDHMALLDKSCSKVLTEVTPYACMKRVEEETGVLFSNEEEDFEAFPNGTVLISETTTNDVETWRDLVSWLAQTICCFATADREGKIVFRPYTDEISDTIDEKNRISGASFSDYVTRYTGLSVVNMEDSTTSYYGLEVDDGLAMNLGSNPFLQYGLTETKEAMRTAILNGLQKINYVPFKVKAIGNPAYDLGDVLVFSGGLADGDQKYCITKYTFRFHGQYEMTGVGQDPSLSSAKSKTDKNIIGLISNTDENTLVHYRFSNTSVVNIGDGKRETLASIRFATATKASEVSFWAELLLDTKKATGIKPGNTLIDDVTISDPPTVNELQEEIEATDKAVKEINTRVTDAENALCVPTPMTARISYMLSGEELDYHPVETYYIDGKHILTLHYYIGSVKANTIYTFVIMLQMDGGTGYFDTDTINAVIEGMGLAGTGQWDGTITEEQDFPGINVKDLFEGLEESVDVGFLLSTPVTPVDAVALDIRRLFGDLTDAAFGTVVYKYFILSDSEGNPTWNDTYVTVHSDDAFVLNTSYSTSSKTEEVGEGFLDVLDICRDYDELISIERMVVT